MSEKSTSQETKEFENGNIKVSASFDKGCVVTFDVQANPEFVRKTHKKSMREFGKKVSLPGFRKGKVPAQMLMRNFPKEIEAETKELFFREAMNEAFNLSRLYPENIQTVKGKELEFSLADESAKLSAQFEIEPNVPEVDFSKIKVKPVERKPVTDKDKEEELERIRQTFATWEDEKERAAKKGDWVVLEASLVDKPEAPQPLWKEERILLTEEDTSPWLFKLVKGMKPGEEKEGMTEASPKAKEIEKKLFIPRKAKVKLLKIQKCKDEPIGKAAFDELKVENLEDLEEKVLKRLEKQRETEARDEEKADAKKQLLKLATEFEVPSTALNDEKGALLRNHLFFLKNSGYPAEIVEKHQENIEKIIEQEASDWLHLFYMARTHAPLLKFSFSQEQMMQHYTMELFYPKLVPLITREMEQKTIQERIVKDLCVERLLTYAIEGK